MDLAKTSRCHFGVKNMNIYFRNFSIIGLLRVLTQQVTGYRDKDREIFRNVYRANRGSRRPISMAIANKSVHTWKVKKKVEN